MPSHFKRDIIIRGNNKVTLKTDTSLRKLNFLKYDNIIVTIQNIVNIYYVPMTFSTLIIILKLTNSTVSTIEDNYLSQLNI